MSEETMSDQQTVDVAELCRRLAEPFEPREVKFRPGATSGNRALALAYIDARAVQDRLDAVVGPQNWQDEYTFLPDGAVICKLSVRLGGEWLTKVDVGSESEQPDEGDRHKAAVSDALKRAAVKYGIGRYLYRLPQAWVDYDPQKKQLKAMPPLPSPQGKPAARHLPATTAAPPKEDQPGLKLVKALDATEKWLARLGLGQPGEMTAAIKAKSKAPLERLDAASCKAALVDCQTVARRLWQSACEERLQTCAIRTLVEALSLADLPIGLTFADMDREQMERLLTTLRDQPADIPI